MMTKTAFVRAVLLCGGVLAAAAPAVSQPAQRTYVDLTGSVGYSTNPGLSLDDDSESAFGRLSLYGVHAWRTERSSTSVSAFLENSYYPNRYGNKQIFDLNAATSYQTSETVNLFGNLGFSGDFGGQLGTRFVAVPVTPLPPSTPTDPQNPTTPTPPSFPDPTIPPPTTIVDPDLLVLSGRQYRLSGQAGVSVRPNERDTWTLSTGAQHIFYSDDLSDRSYTTYSLTGAYSRQLNERVSVGFRTSVHRTDYPGSDSTTFVSPQVTVQALIDENWTASAAAGVTYRIQDFDGDSDGSLGLAFDGSICRALERSRLCGRLSRNSQNTIAEDLLTTTSAGLDYSHILDQDSSIQLSASAVHYSGRRVLDRNVSSNYFTTSAAYNRRINDRLTGGVTGSVRKLSQFGPDPDTDLSASVFLRYRLGDLQ